MSPRKRKAPAKRITTGELADAVIALGERVEALEELHPEEDERVVVGFRVKQEEEPED